MNQIVLATQNRHKAEEFRGLLAGIGLEVRTLDEFPGIGEIVEDASTLEGNALKKARAVFRHTGIAALADDTGLEVRYLNDAPGVYSSRYAGPGATYADNVRKLLEEMRGVPPRRRGARFRCVLALVRRADQEKLAEGIVHGVITEQPRGTGGFGYDPVFLPDGHDRTFAQMPLEMKNSLSHRARAAAAMKEILRQY